MNDQMYTPQHVANFFLERAKCEGYGLTPMKLLKIVYIGYGWVLALTNKKLFDTEIEAWQHGPVIPSLYHEFKEYGRGPISRLSFRMDFKEEISDFEVYSPEIPKNDADIQYILGRVWDVYKDLDGWELRNKTHEHDTPWSKVYIDGERGCVLSDDDIREYYRTKLAEYLH